MKPRRLLALAVGAVAVVIGLEGIARLSHRVRGMPWDAETSRASTRRLCDALALESSVLPAPASRVDGANEPKMLQPYVGWELPSAQMRVAIDAESYRAGRREAFDVCILGGSAAKGIAEALAEDPRLRERNVRVHDYSTAGYKQPQTSKLLGWLLALGHRPDAVVEIDGADEVRLADANAAAGVHPGYPSIASWSEAAGGMRSDWGMVERLHAARDARDRSRGFGEWLLDSGLWKSCLLDHLAGLRLRTLEKERIEARRRLEEYVGSRPENAELRGPAFARERAPLDATIVSVWERAARSAAAMCAAREIPFVLALAPSSPEDAEVLRPLKSAGGSLEGATTRFLDLSDVESSKVAAAIATGLLGTER